MTCPEAEVPFSSFDICSASEAFSKKTTVYDDDGLVVPFPLLHGEFVEYLGRVTEGVIALSNYRCLIRSKKWFANIPLGLIESVDMREIFYITISCKDATSVKCSFSTNDTCQIWYKRLIAKTGSPKDLNTVFALSYHAWCMDDNTSGSHSSTSQTGSPYLCHMNEEGNTYRFDKEIERMKFDTADKKVWKMTHINEKFSVSPSYPKIHIVPESVSDESLMSVASFRSMRRFPSVVWRSISNGAVIVRCSQPELGWLGWRNEDDESLLKAIPKACSLNPGTDNNIQQSGTTEVKKMLLIDCRSYSAAFANRAKGGGCESADYYPTCEIQFMNLANIHSIRKSFIALQTLTSSFSEQVNWYSSLENTKWLQYIGAIIRAANLVVSTIDKEARPVLVHCSDGWDRTPQIVALAQLLLDPYYRKIEGFQALIEREWLEFGHKFADRCGHTINSDDTNERSPVFLQWLDCVFQVYRQFPCAFEFNEAFLIKLVHHTYSRLFGNFLFNTVKERIKENLSKRTTSIWSLLNPKNTKFYNLLYQESAEQQVLYPEFSMNSLSLWKSVYLSNSSLSTHATEDFLLPLETGDITPDIETMSLQKTRSCENLAKLQDHPPVLSRRLSDPNILYGSQELISAACKDLDLDSSQNEDDMESKEEITESRNMNGEADLTNGCVSNGINGLDEEKERSYTEENGDICDDETELIQEVDRSDMSLQDDRPLPLVNGHDQPITNGHTKENEMCMTNHKHCNIENKKHLEKSVESSTDTITEDEFHEKKSDNLTNNLTNGMTNGHTTPLIGYTNGHVITDELEALDEKQYSSKPNLVSSNSTMSTSTSDISDSFVRPVRNGWNSAFSDLRLASQSYNGCHMTPNKLCNGHGGVVNSKSMINSASPSPTTSPFPTPNNSITPSSTCPPTPDTTTKSCDWGLNRQLSGVGRYLDCDGLTTFVDPIQQRMHQKEMEYQRQIETLTHKLAFLQKSLRCNGTYKMEYREDDLYLSEDTEGEHCSSLGNVSNPASDISWENLEIKDAPLTLWIPDHAVTHCASCQSAFWTAKRKHHCRSCGKVFCADCSNYYSPVPNQHLKEPVRVCRTCHDHLQLTRDIFEDHRVAQTASE